MPTVTNYLVSSLPAYVEQNRDLIIKNFALVGRDTRSRIGLRTGIKTGQKVPFLDFGIVLQNGATCGHNPLDEAVLSQRDIVVEALKHDGEVCPETLLGTYAEYLVRINATENELPYEAYLMDAMTREVNKVIEKLIWQGDKTNGTGNMKMLDGFLVQLAADTDVIPVTIAAGDDAYAAITKVYLAMPEEALERGGVIFVSPALYRDFLQALVAANLFHYPSAENANPDEFILPGSDVRVIKTYGISGSKKIVGTFAENLIYATDVEGDEVDVDLWWSQDARVFKYQVKWTSGVTYFFPDMIAIATAN